MRVEWKCASVVDGELCVMMDGAPRMPKLFADNLDIKFLVLFLIYSIYHSSPPPKQEQEHCIHTILLDIPCLS
jgi:hypothetical protein